VAKDVAVPVGVPAREVGCGVSVEVGSREGAAVEVGLEVALAVRDEVGEAVALALGVSVAGAEAVVEAVASCPLEGVLVAFT
jgi:hypothetical protein